MRKNGSVKPTLSSKSVTIAQIVTLMLAAAVMLLPAAPSRAAAALAGRIDAPKPGGLAVHPILERAYVAQQDGDLAVVDTRTFAVLERVPMKCCLVDVSASAGVNGKVYVSGNGVIVMDAATNVVEATVSVTPGAADAIVVDDSTARVYVALPNEDTIAVINMQTNEVVGRWPAGDRPEALALGTGALYVADLDGNEVRAIDTATGLTALTAPIPQPAAMTLDPANGHLYVAAGDGTVRVLDAATFGSIRTIVLGGKPSGVAFNPGNGRLWVSDAVTTAVWFIRSSDGAPLGRIPVGNAPGGAVFDARFARAYVSATGSDAVVALSEGPGIVDILTPFQDSFVGPSKMVVTGTAPSGSPVTVTENGATVGVVFADLTSRWSMPMTLPEGSHTIVASVPEERPSAPRTFVVDLTPPSLTLTYRTPPNAAGWNNTYVLLRWSCTDAGSGVTEELIEKILSSEGRNLSMEAKCKDRAANQATNTVTGLNVDRTAPSIVAKRTPPANIAGWNRTSPVTVEFTCADALSGMTGPTTSTFTAAGETQGKTFGMGCTDIAGNVRGRVETVRIDLRAPTTTVDGLIPLAAPGIPVRGQATDGPSGAAAVEVRFVDQDGAEMVVPAACSAACGDAVMRWRTEPPQGLNPGLYLVSARATDVAGNIGEWSAESTFVVISAPVV